MQKQEDFVSFRKALLEHKDSNVAKNVELITVVDNSLCLFADPYN